VAGISDPVRVVVCDAGPLIHLDELDALDLLHDFPLVLVPDAVWSEVERHRPTVFLNPGQSFTRIAPQHPLGPALVAVSRLFPLHAGETQALAVASEQGADLLLTDNRAAGRGATRTSSPRYPGYSGARGTPSLAKLQPGGRAAPSDTWPLHPAHPPCTVG